MSSEPSSSDIEITIVFKGLSIARTLPSQTTFEALQHLIAQESHVPSSGQKLLAPKIGLIKPTSLPQGLETPISVVFPTPQSRKRILLMGTPVEQIDELHEAEQSHAAQRRHQAQRYNIRKDRSLRSIRSQVSRNASPANTNNNNTTTNPSSSSSSTPLRRHNATNNIHGFADLQNESTQGNHATSFDDDDTPNTPYTFHKLVPLPFLPNPERSRELLRQLRDDRGIQAIMKKYRWSVPVLTELDPLSNTTHNARLLGLNRNKGQVIELRLRTDNYKGWLRFKDVRQVLCHELTHNVHSEHDDNFWNMFHVLEREAINLDPFGKGGRRVTEQEFYNGPGLRAGDDGEGNDDEDADIYADHEFGRRELYDEGGWIGGTYRLGTADDDNNNKNNNDNISRTGTDEEKNNNNNRDDGHSSTDKGKHTNDVKAILRQAAIDRERRQLEARASTVSTPTVITSKSPSPSSSPSTSNINTNNSTSAIVDVTTNSASGSNLPHAIITGGVHGGGTSESGVENPVSPKSATTVAASSSSHHDTSSSPPSSSSQSTAPSGNNRGSSPSS